MPKSSKKRKEKVADFSKAKLKLGKGRKLPSNVVDTSFKARSIALPTQSIAVEKDDTLPTTKRKQSFNDILSLLKHYNAGTRKDAIFSARELLEDHPEILDASITSLFGACVRLIGDEDSGVRKALLSFFSWLLPRIARNDLIPHIPILLLFTTSAQTHIFPEIRIDAIQILNLFLDVVPEAVVDGWNGASPGHGKRVLDGYLGILNAGTKFGTEDTAHVMSTASVVLSPQSRLVVLQSLSSFLSHAVYLIPSATSSDHAPNTIALPTWYMAPSFTSPQFYGEHAHIFQKSREVKNMIWSDESQFESLDEDFVYDPAAALVSPTPATFDDFLDLAMEASEPSGSSSTSPFLVRLARTLHPTLTAAFLDCGPVVFSPSQTSPETNLLLLTAALKIARTLYSVILHRNSSDSDLATCCEDLKTLLGYLTGYFPFKPVHSEIKMENAFQDMNVMFCELTSLVVFVSSQTGTGDGHRTNSRSWSSRKKALSVPTRGSAKLGLQAGLVSSYVICLLRGEGEPNAQLPRPVSPMVYVALLPTIWALLNQATVPSTPGETTVTSAVLSATLDHALRTASTSTVKRLTVEFVSRLLLLEKERGYIGRFNPVDAGEDGRFQEWVLHLPKVLWESGANNLTTSETIIRALLRLLQRGSFAIQHEHVSSLASRLIPFFWIQHPARGQLSGPFNKISSVPHVRRLLLHLCATILEDQMKRGARNEELYEAVCKAVVDTAETDIWIQLTEAMCPT